MLIAQMGIKQNWLAEQAGVSQTALSTIVNGKAHPNVKTALKIAKALGVTVEYLWGEEENGKEN